MTDAFSADAAFAAQLAADAGQLLITVRSRSGLTDKALGREGDAAANRLLCEAIRSARPDDGLLSEEEKDDPARLAKRRVWIIDPVDGTREYGEARSDWAVHVALTLDGVPVAGAVALPGLDGGVVLRSDQPQPLAPMAEHPRFLVSRSRPAAEARDVALALGGTLVPMGSAGAKAMAVVRGEAEVYLHSGGQYEWDSCAPVAVATAHGLHCSRLDGSPLFYNRPDTFMPDLLICRREWAEKVLRRVSGSAPLNDIATG